MSITTRVMPQEEIAEVLKRAPSLSEEDKKEIRRIAEEAKKKNKKPC